MFTLLKEGLPWDYVNELTPEEISLILAVLTVQQRQELETQAKMQGLGR